MTPPRRTRLTEADRTAWAAYAHAIRPLRGRVAAEMRPAHAIEDVAARHDVRSDRHGMPPAPPRAVSRSRTGSAAGLPPHVGTGLAIGEPPAGLDSATWQRFRTGKLAATRKLDLHGMTAQRAFHALSGFLRTANAERLRCVEVVTGRGSGEGTGVIRRELPLWLNQPALRPLVLAAAYPHAANPGAVRLLLRRVR